MNKIVIIGAGNIGSRHLQAMALLDRDAQVQVIDPSIKSLSIAKDRFDSLGECTHDISVTYETDMDKVAKDADIAIVATSSGPRRQVVEYLINNTLIKNLILEKVIFQSVRDLYEIGQQLECRGIQAWVDCARRNNSFYQELRDRLVDESYVNMIVDGGEWGMGCNSLHFLDLYAFLTNEYIFSADNRYLDQKILNSKRDGYIEFTGEEILSCNKGQMLLKCNKGSISPISITVVSERFYCFIDEGHGRAYIKEVNSDEPFYQKRLDDDLISHITQTNVESILDKGDCYLPNYDESVSLQAVLVQSFLEHLNKVRKGNLTSCPIT